MARLFTLNFHFKEKTYTALVSFRTIGYDMSFQVRYMDNEIHQIIPGGRLMFNLSGTVIGPDNLNTEPAKELLTCTSEAISGYLKANNSAF
jgi:hypothetical protein